MGWLIQILEWAVGGPQKGPASRSRESSDELLLDQTLAHAKDGYRNAQEVIKTVDAKTAVITGLSTLSAGFLVALGKWAIESPAALAGHPDQIVQNHPYFECAIYAAVVASLLCALFCLGFAVWSVIARDRPKHLKGKFTVLFPLVTPDAGEAAQLFFESRLKGMTKADILQEYEDQLRVVGTILCRKIKYNRRACWALLLQFILAATVLALIAFLYLLG